MPELIAKDRQSRICVVDDDASQLSALAHMLQPEFDVCVARNGRDALRLLKRDPPDLVLLDVEMPELDGFAVCRSIKDDPLTCDLPIVFLTSHVDEATEVRGLNSGAADFITKPLRGPAVLARIRNLVRMKLLADRLRTEALTDPLTGLANRSHLMRMLRDEVLRSQRQRKPLSALLVDVDHFKAYNDHYGHLSGDGALRQVGRVLRQSMRRAGDLAGRIGGEEFALLLPDTDLAGACQVAQGLVHAMVEQRLPHAGSRTAAFISLSVGVASFVPPSGEAGRDSEPLPLHGDVGEDLLGRADAALYEAKRRGRNQVRLENGQPATISPDPVTRPAPSSPSGR